MIERHFLRPRHIRNIAEDFERRTGVFSTIINKINSNSSDVSYFVNSLYGLYLELAAYELYLNKDEKLYWKYFLKSVQCCKNFYKLSLSSKEKELIKLDDIGDFELERGTYINFITPWHFRTHLKLALLARDNELLGMLAQIKEEKFDPEKAGLSGDRFHLLTFRYINEILNGNNDIKVKELYDEAYKAVVDYFEDEGDSYTESSIYFDLELLKAVREKDTVTFNERLAGRLESFKNFYGESGNESRIDGLYAPIPTGLAAFAYDQGMEITVESDYMPRFLVEGKFAEEKIKWPMG